MTQPTSPTDILGQINSARDQTYQNLALVQAQLNQANQAAASAAQDRAAIQAIAQQTVTVDTSVGTRVFAGDTMIHGDTGWREFVISPDGKAWVTMRRVGTLIELTGRIESNFSESATQQPSIGLPPGFRPRGAVRLLYGESGGTPNKMAVIGSSGQVSFYSRTPATAGDMTVSQYMTPDPWPTSLPGVAV